MMPVREDLRRALDRMVLQWGTSTTWRIYWARMVHDMTGGDFWGSRLRAAASGTPTWTEIVGRA